MRFKKFVLAALFAALASCTGCDKAISILDVGGVNVDSRNQAVTYNITYNITYPAAPATNG